MVLFKKEHSVLSLAVNLSEEMECLPIHVHVFISPLIVRRVTISSYLSANHAINVARRIPLDEGTSDIPTPSVLLAFRRHNRHSLAHPPGITFRKGSFCAVFRRTFTTRRTRRGTVSVSEDNSKFFPHILLNPPPLTQTLMKSEPHCEICTA